MAIRSAAWPAPRSASFPDAVTLEAGGARDPRTGRRQRRAPSLGALGGDERTEPDLFGLRRPVGCRPRRAGLEVEGHYRLGYTKVEEPDALVTAPGAEPVDIFDEQHRHMA